MFEAINIKNKIRLVIEHDDTVGYYLYVYQLRTDKTIADHLCDDLEAAFEEAEACYQVRKADFTKLIK